MAAGSAEEDQKKPSWEWSISGAYRYLLQQQASYGAIAATGAGALVVGAVLGAGAIVASPKAKEQGAEAVNGAVTAAAAKAAEAIDPVSKRRATLVALKALGVASLTTGAFVFGVITACDAVGIRTGEDVRHAITGIIRPSAQRPPEAPPPAKSSARS